GADRAILIESGEELQPLAVAKLLKALVDREQPQLIILGKQAIDDDSNQTGQMLAALANLPQATFASKVVVADGKATVSREVD
ncbi:electron transporter RnfB, partial [Pseudomonas sp. FW301-21B01]